MPGMPFPVMMPFMPPTAPSNTNQPTPKSQRTPDSSNLPNIPSMSTNMGTSSAPNVQQMMAAMMTMSQMMASMTGQVMPSPSPSVTTSVKNDTSRTDINTSQTSPVPLTSQSNALHSIATPAPKHVLPPSLSDINALQLPTNAINNIAKQASTNHTIKTPRASPTFSSDKETTASFNEHLNRSTIPSNSYNSYNNPYGASQRERSTDKISGEAEVTFKQYRMQYITIYILMQLGNTI